MKKLKFFIVKYHIGLLLSFLSWFALICLLFYHVGDVIMSVPTDSFLLICFLCLCFYNCGKDFLYLFFDILYDINTFILCRKGVIVSYKDSNDDINS